MQTGYVELLQIQREKGLPFEPVLTAELLEGKGISLDCHALGGEKQIALISESAKQSVTNQELFGLCYGKFQENIVISGMDFNLLKEGDILITKNTKIKIAAYTKRCFPECMLIQNEQLCELKLGIRFGKVLQSGKLENGEIIWQE